MNYLVRNYVFIFVKQVQIPGAPLLLIVTDRSFHKTSGLHFIVVWECNVVARYCYSSKITEVFRALILVSTSTAVGDSTGSVK